MSSSHLFDETPLTAAVGQELRRLFRPPYAELLTVGLNVAMVSVGWFLLPTWLKTWLFDNLHGAIAFAVVLETWMLSDVTSTNLLGHDEAGAVAALRRDDGMRRFVLVKTLALTVLIGLPSAVVGVILGLHGRNHQVAIVLAPMFLALPMGIIAVTSWLGIVFPYRLHSLRWRWQHRRNWRMLLRWGLLVVVPYLGLSPTVSALLVPAKLLADQVTGYRRGSGPPPTSAVQWMVFFVVAECALLLAIGVRGAQRLADRRRDHLITYFHDPGAG